MEELEELEELFDNLHYDEPSHEHLNELYTIFKSKIVSDDFRINGNLIKVNTSPRTKYPFEGKMEGFVHVITRESKHKGKGHREFERERANRIHWIRPIVENADLVMIKVFRRLHSNGQWQQFFWFEEKNFVVLIREIHPDFLLITAYCVDKQNRNQFMRWYREYKGL